MQTLIHYRLCPFSRSVLIALAELAIDVALNEEKPWEWRTEFLALNPAGELPVLELDGGQMLCGAYAISEYLADEVHQHPLDGQSVPLFPGNAVQRAEVRRLVDWFHGKFDRDVLRDLQHEKLFARLARTPPRSPDPEVLRAVRTNLRYHMSYIGHLADHRRWLAGDEMSFADIAAAAQLSCVDYFGEVPWEEYASAKGWYVRMKSRPSFRTILAARVPGLTPPSHYDDLDF